jgi:hypothetical protein
MPLTEVQIIEMSKLYAFIIEMSKLYAFIIVKLRMAIRKVSPKKGVALLLSINVGLILFRKFCES